MEKCKTVKDYCKEAKKRLKSGFWQNYKKNLNEEMERAKEGGISETKIKDYLSKRVSDKISGKITDEEFYNKVKSILDAEGEVSDAIGRLTDEEYYNGLSYEEKQRYTLSLSEKYLKAVERYKKEKSMSL